MDVAGINAQLAEVQSAITAVGTKVDGLIAANAAGSGTPVATQADLDGISSSLSAAKAALDAINAK